MRIALISDSPALPTGWARNARALITVLTDLGHTVSCYAIGVFGTVVEDPLYRCRIWPYAPTPPPHRTTLPQFFASEKPDVILINYDLLDTFRWLRRVAADAPGLPVISHLVVDGLPVYPELLRPLNQCTAVIVVTPCVQDHVAAAVSVPVYYFPHMVDCTKFHPLPEASRIKRALFGDALVIGAIAQNTNRKQLVQTLHAIRLLKDAGRHPVFLLRTDRLFGVPRTGNALRKVVEYLGVQDVVHISESDTRISDVAAEVAGTSRRFGPALKLDQIGDLTVSELLNLCDVALVASAFGGFEYGIIEAQSCGIPVCITDDEGIMMEVAGGACEPMKPAFFELTAYGAKIWKLAPSAIATAITTIVDTPHRHATLQAAGIANAKRYDWAKNKEMAAAVLGKILGSVASANPH